MINNTCSQNLPVAAIAGVIHGLACLRVSCMVRVSGIRHVLGKCIKHITYYMQFEGHAVPQGFHCIVVIKRCKLHKVRQTEKKKKGTNRKRHCYFCYSTYIASCK